MDGLVSFFQANAAQYIIPRTQLRSSLQRWPSPALVRPLTNDASCPFAALVPPARRSARFLHGLSSTASETQKTRGGTRKMTIKIKSDLADVISDGEHVALPSKCNTRHSSERGVFCRPIPVHGAARQVRKLEGILLVLAAKGEQLSVRREREDRDGCDELLEATCGFRVRLDRVDARLVCREELGTVVDVRDTAVRADSDPPVVAKGGRTLVAAERDDNAADAALVVPDAEELSLFHAVLANLAASSQNREAVARAPPRKVRDTVTAVEARCGDPLP
ncbi:hypothetical protein BN1708_009149 [Verticillium longisporum]|uniref:Uncharacterized protein n=1 Tax=Verticillium longisporum TaxID=100787 RepID=A0A0G4KE35_VERLO|nr:hypothetical protein BN1708_009149 [Verticillium longisporum]